MLHGACSFRTVSNSNQIDVMETQIELDTTFPVDDFVSSCQLWKLGDAIKISLTLKTTLQSDREEVKSRLRYERGWWRGGEGRAGEDIYTLVVFVFHEIKRW